MSDQAFETRLARVLATYADEAVVPIDASRIALAARPNTRSPLARLVAVAQARPSAEVRILLLAAALLAALVGTSLLLAGGGRRTQPGLLDTSPTPSAPSGPAFAAGDLVGSWIADMPEGLSLGGAPTPARMTLLFDTNATNALLTTTTDPTERFRAEVGPPGGDRMAFTSRVAGDPATLAGDQLRGCAPGEQGTYRASRSTDGLLLTLEPVDDTCPSRAAVFARTWVRSFGEFTSGGLGVVDAFEPLFSIDLPRGSYAVDRGVPDAITISQPVPEFAFLAFKDPQGFLDPCDTGAGRYDIAPGADAVVAYFRQLEGFTVDSVTEREVDGHRALTLVVNANADASCPSGSLAEWQPAAVTSSRHWMLRPGDTDTLVIVELADATVMFQVLPGPTAAGDRAIDSIRFLDQLPTSP
jgi:hypothetical protein